MFRHILVPLDGSRMAEAALPAAVLLSRSFGSRVTLFHVIERGAPQEIHGERHLSDPHEAREYLREVSRLFTAVGVTVAIHVHDVPESSVSRSIADHGEAFATDLVVMCTHGKGGLRAFLFGRIAQQVAALSATPVMFVQPGEKEPLPGFACRRLLVPLDGDAEHEDGLSVARDLAGTLEAELHLVMVVPNISNLPGEEAAAARMSPRVAGEILDIIQHEAADYLDSQMKMLEGQGISVTSTLFRGDPVEGIAEVAEMSGADIVVLGTHGKTGLDAFWSRSATPHLSRRVRIPFLLVPVQRRSAKSRGVMVDEPVPNRKEK
jgi:nucleotide-binding universal stress UspA family protein